MTDFGELLYRSLPGLYRDKDETNQLRLFLNLASVPLAEIEKSIAELHSDFFLNTSRDSFIPLIGSLLGLAVDPRLPARVQRADVLNAIRLYREKGLSNTLADDAQRFTGFPVVTVDFSNSVSSTPFLRDSRPIIALRNQPVVEESPGSGRFFFAGANSPVQLYDAARGRKISRSLLDGQKSRFIDVAEGFSIKENGQSVFQRSASPAVAKAADLSNFSAPLTAAGAPLRLVAGEIAVDPVLGRFLFAVPHPLAANLLVNYQTLAAASPARQVFDLRNSTASSRLGRSDDPAPYTLDVRSSAQPSDSVGRMHFDNYGFFFTPGRVVTGICPRLLTRSAPLVFSFDSSALDASNPDGITLQLMDGLDGTPLTREKLAADASSYWGTPRGFSIRVANISLSHLSLLAANLSDVSNPKDLQGSALAANTGTVAIDPEVGRFVLDQRDMNGSPDRIYVDFLLGPAQTVRDNVPLAITSIDADVFSFSSDGRPLALRDGFDGSRIGARIRLGATVDLFHGTPRGWSIRVNGQDVKNSLSAIIQKIPSPVARGTVGIDLDRGYFQFPPGFLNPGDSVTIDFTHEDTAGSYRLLEAFAERISPLMPAGVNAVIKDSLRKPPIPALLN